ncbi:MAG: hypothetical protein J6Y94_05575, partial [Bacteriovoracaceae bacterium]|nr:hypothetical protein [Bacteriovoracaceae bacterium]
MKTRAARQCFLLLLLAIFVFCGGKTTTVLAATSDLLANPDAAPLLTKRVLEEVRTAYQRLNEAALALRNELKANDPLHYQEQFAELVSRNNVALDTEYGEAAVTTVDNKFAIRVVHQASGGSFIFVRIPELTTHAEVAINERDAQDLDQSARDLAQIYPRQVLATPGPNQVQQIAQEIEASALGQKRSAHQKALQKDLLNERLPNLLDEAQSLEPAKSIGLRLLLARQHVDSNNLKGRHTVLVALTDVEISSGMASVEDVFKLQQGGNVKFYPNPRTSTRLPFYRKFALRIHDYWVATVVRPDMKDIQFGLISGITQFLVVTGIDLLHRMASGESFDLGAINYGPEIFTGIYGTVLGVYYQAYKTFLFRGYQSATKLFCKQWGSKLVFMVGMWALGYFDIRGGVIAAMWHIFANSYITIYFKNYLNTYPNFKRDLRESTYTLREWLQKEERHPLFKWFEEYSWARHLLEIKVSNYLYQSFYFSYFIPKMLDLKGGKSFVRMMMVAGIPSLQYFASYLPLRYKLRRSYLDFLQHPEYSAPEQETKTQNIAILKKSLYDSANSWWSTKKIALTAPVWLNNVITTPLYKMLLGPLAKFLYGQNERHELLDARVGAFLDEEFRQNRLAPRFHLLYEKRILDASVKAVIRRDLQAAALADDLKEILENFWQNKNLDPALQERLWQLVAPSFAQNWPQVKTLADFKRQFNIWFKDHAREALWQEVALRAPLEEAGQMDFATAQTFIDILHLVNLPSDVYQQVRQFWVSEAYTVPQVSGRLTKIISEVSQMHFALERTENLAAEDKKFLGQMVQDGYAPLAMPQAVQTYIQQLSKWRGLRWEKPPFREEAVASLLQLGALPRQGVIRRMAAIFPDVEAYFAHVAEDLPSIKEEWRRPVKNFGTKMVKQAAQIRATPRFKEFFGQWQMQVEQVCTLVPYSCKNTLFADRDFIGPVPEDAAPWAAEEQALAQAMQRPDCAAAGSPDCLKQVAAQLNSATVLDTVLATPLLASRSYVRAASVDQVNGQVVSSQDPWPVPPEKLRPATQVKVPDDRTLLAAAAPVSKVTSWGHHAARWAMGPHRANNRLKNISNDHTMQGFDQLMAGDVAEAMMQYDQKMWQGSEAAKMVSPELLAWLNHLARQNHLTAAEGGDFIAQAARQGKAVLAQALPWRLQQLVLDAWREEQDRLTEIHHALEQTKAQAKLSLAVQDFLFDLRQEGSVASGHTVLPILSEASLAALDAALEHGYLPAELPEDLRQAFSLERDNARLDAEVHAFLEDVHQQRYLSWEAVQAMDKIARPSLGQQQQLRKVLASLDADLRLVQQVAQHGAPVVQRLQEFAALDEIRLGGQSFTPEQTAFYEQQIKFLRHTVGLTPQALGPYTLGEKVAFI